MRAWFLSASVAAVSLFAAGIAAADDVKEAKEDKKGPIVLKVVSKKDKYVFDGGGKTPKEYKESLEAIAKKLKNGQPARPPRPLAVDLVLQFENISKEAVTIHVEGDSNVYRFDLTGGAGVVNMLNPVVMTLEFRLPKAVTIEPGKCYEIPVKILADGIRGFSRLVFWTGPGDYKPTAKYILVDKGGQREPNSRAKRQRLVVIDK